jgi:hypothetical protein
MEEPLATLVDPFKDGSGKALYRLEGNALDESGNFNGTATSVTYGNGISGRAILKSANQGIITVAPSLFAFGTGNFSVNIWCKFTTFADVTRFFFSGTLSTGANTNGTSLQVSSAGKVRWSPNNIATPQSTATLVAGNWYMLTYTRSGTVGNLYINAVFDNTQTDSTNFATNAGASLYGITGANYPDVLLFDQVRIFNRALTLTEITELYTKGA